MPINLVQPTEEIVRDPKALLTVLLRMWNQLLALQADDPVEAAARGQGKAEVVVIRGATVTAPGSTVSFTADVFVLGVRT